jgi:hypothetical protein
MRICRMRLQASPKDRDGHDKIIKIKYDLFKALVVYFRGIHIRKLNKGIVLFGIFSLKKVFQRFLFQQFAFRLAEQGGKPGRCRSHNNTF